MSYSVVARALVDRYGQTHASRPRRGRLLPLRRAHRHPARRDRRPGAGALARRLRQLRAEGHDGDRGADGVQKLLQDFPGSGPTGADILCREVQGVWGELAPFVDHRVQDGASAVGLPTEPEKLVALVPAGDLVALVSGCVPASLSTDVVDDGARAVLGR
ncbi:MAG: hypothetical protein ABI181_10405 [Mycobacteriaceae bacterium]